MDIFAETVFWFEFWLSRYRPPKIVVRLWGMSKDLAGTSSRDGTVRQRFPHTIQAMLLVLHSVTERGTRNSKKILLWRVPNGRAGGIPVYCFQCGHAGFMYPLSPLYRKVFLKMLDCRTVRYPVSPVLLWIKIMMPEHDRTGIRGSSLVRILSNRKPYWFLRPKINNVAAQEFHLWAGVDIP